MPISERLAQLGSGVFARNDQRKLNYRQRAAEQGLAPLLDLSLGSTDLQPPPAAIAAMAAALQQPESASYCLHGATRPFREAVAAWARALSMSFLVRASAILPSRPIRLFFSDSTWPDWLCSWLLRASAVSW